MEKYGVQVASTLVGVSVRKLLYWRHTGLIETTGFGRILKRHKKRPRGRPLEAKNKKFGLEDLARAMIAKMLFDAGLNSRQVDVVLRSLDVKSFLASPENVEINFMQKPTYLIATRNTHIVRQEVAAWREIQRATGDKEFAIVFPLSRVASRIMDLKSKHEVLSE